jgi:hypothetical protein
MLSRCTHQTSLINFLAVQVADLSELIYAYCLEKEFKETEVWLPELMWEMKLNLLALGSKTRKGMWQLLSLSTGK